MTERTPHNIPVSMKKFINVDVFDEIVAEVKKASVEKPYDGQAFGGEQIVRTQDVLDIIYKHMEGVSE